MNQGKTFILGRSKLSPSNGEKRKYFLKDKKMFSHRDRTEKYKRIYGGLREKGGEREREREKRRGGKA